MFERIIECLKKWRIKRLTKPYEISKRELEVLIKYGCCYSSSFTNLIISAGEKISKNYSFYNAESTFEDERILYALERKWCV